MRVLILYPNQCIKFLNLIIMKSFILTISIMLMSLTNVMAYDVHSISNDENLAMLNIDITLTSKDGCEFHITGELDLTWTGGFEGFTGTVTASGGEGCPNGTWVFGMIINNPGGDDPINVNEIRFIGTNPLIDVLKNEPKTLTKLIELFESNG